MDSNESDMSDGKELDPDVVVKHEPVADDEGIEPITIKSEETYDSKEEPQPQDSDIDQNHHITKADEVHDVDLQIGEPVILKEEPITESDSSMDVDPLLKPDPDEAPSTSSGEKPVTCDICGFRVRSNSELALHVRTHLGEKPYTCDLCAYKGGTRANLARHMRRHRVNAIACFTSAARMAPGMDVVDSVAIDPQIIVPATSQVQDMVVDLEDKGLVSTSEFIVDPNLDSYQLFSDVLAAGAIETDEFAEFSIENKSCDGPWEVDYDPESDGISVDMDTYESDKSVMSDEVPVSDNASERSENVEDVVQKGKRRRGKDHCFYCQESVLQFGRHIERNHPYEMDVQQILSRSKGSRERKDLITMLRKKGNFLFSSLGTPKPVRKAMLGESSDSLPCPYCKGFYARKQLWRHKKKCGEENEKNGEKSTRFIQGFAQNMLLGGRVISPDLQEKVFPRMRADGISLQAKKDALICAYGERFMKNHREKCKIPATSRKMRELAKILLEIKKIDPRIKSLIDALRPQHFDTLVQAAKAAAGFDDKEDQYVAPMYAVNISTSLKECCELAVNFLYKKAHSFDAKSVEAAESEINTTIMLIRSNWKYELTHHAANHLHANRMNKVTIVPLASDLKRLEAYLTETGDEMASNLNRDPTDMAAYRSLTEVVYCRVMLLCRKTCGELSRIPLSLYLEAGNRHSYEEFAGVVNPSEMLLVRKFRRVVIQGKSQVTPVLFPFDVQEHIQVLLDLRNNFVSEKNEYLFASTNTDKHIFGHQVLVKHASKAGLTNYKTIGSRSLRKHLATLSQVLSMNEQDIQQLVTFMGHTGAIHRKDYRLPDDVYQTAKFSKLLMMMESGNIAEHKVDKQYACELCDYQAASKSRLTRHVYTHTGQKPFTCEICGLSLVYNCELAAHMTTHTGEKPYECDICGYKAGRRIYITSHMRTHRDDKPFSCSFCNYTAQTASTLKVHVRTHTGERPFSCDQCDYTAIKKWMVISHQKKHTGEKPYKCSNCDYATARKWHLLRHTKSHEGEKS